MTQATKKNLKVLIVLVLLLGVSIVYLVEMANFTSSVLRYAACQSEIKFLEENGNKYGWTDKRYNEVKEAESEREKIAKTDAVFGWLNASRSKDTECWTRNVLIVALYMFELIAVTVSIGTTVIIVLRMYDHLRKFLNKHQEVVCFIEKVRQKKEEGNYSAQTTWYICNGIAGDSQEKRFTKAG